MSHTATPRSGDEAGAPTEALPLRAGRFGYRRGQETVWWTRPATALPDRPEAEPPAIGRTEVAALVSHVHPEDRPLLTEILGARKPCCLRLRLQTGSGGEREVLAVGEPARDADGVDGYYIDLTAALAAQHRAVLDEALPRLVATHAVVEQATGMLRLIYGITAERAQAILRWRATETGLSPHAFATRLCAAVAGGEPAPAAVRVRVDDLLLTAHRRGPG